MTNDTAQGTATSLRERLIDDMNVRRLSVATQRNYVRDVARFAGWLGRPPDQATDEDLRRYQIEQSETGLGAPSASSRPCSAMPSWTPPRSTPAWQRARSRT